MYHPTSRVLSVLELLQYRPGITGPELAARLEVDARTVRRYVEKLRDVGIPVESLPGRYGGYRLRAGYKVPPLIFTEEEATALVLGLIGSPRLGIDLPSAGIAAAISKITRVLSRDAQERLHALSSLLVLSEGRSASRPKADLLIDLSHAVQSNRTIRLIYTSQRGATTVRIVEPYGLVGLKSRWYLVGFCRLREDFRTFRLDRIVEVAVQRPTFERNAAFDYRAYVAEHVETYPGTMTYTVVFHGDSETVRTRLAGAGGRLEERPSGVIFMGRTDDYEYEAAYLAGLHLPFTVVEPVHLRRAVAALGLRLQKSAVDPNHGEGTPSEQPRIP
ncbi:MAG: YafY family transcriptional regulator [Spirochaetales bacterium]|nr:YafY family transcriptional regulator [Spirochaetales bacterium]